LSSVGSGSGAFLRNFSDLNLKWPCILYTHTHTYILYIYWTRCE